MKKIFLLFGVGIALSMTSCDSFLDINLDPNSPAQENVNASLIFPGVEMNLAASYGDYLRITGGYLSQHYAQDFGTSNYTDYSQFSISTVRSSGTYTQLTAKVLLNLETVRKNAKASEEWGTYLAATTLRAFTYQTLVDAYGEIPYTEALDVSNLSPHFDGGQTVYDGILAELDEALSKAAPTNLVCTNFLFGTTTADKWIKFANALKIRILMRESNVKDVHAELAALISENNLPTEDVSYNDCWTDNPGKASPFYQEEYSPDFGSTQINVVANIAYMQTLVSSNDTVRLAFAFNKSDKGAYTGAVSGTNMSQTTKFKADYWCRPVFKYNMPVFMMTVSDIEFFKAEYYARYGTASDAETHYKAAIKASFTTVGGKETDAAFIYNNAYPYNNANFKKVIGIQKWIALGMTNNFEAWCELRRLGYPAFGTITGDDITDQRDVYTPNVYTQGTLYQPIDVNTDLLGKNKVLQRFMYPESSTSRNINAPVNKLGSEPVFWAVQ